jgi:hypothetical protein
MRFILASFGIWLARRFASVRPGEVLVEPRPNLMDSTDAALWAKEFVGYQNANPAIAFDEATMLAWFSSAIMVGIDKTKAAQKPSPVMATMAIDDWLDNWPKTSYGVGTTVFFIRNEDGVSCRIGGMSGSTKVECGGTGHNSTVAFIKTVAEVEKTIGSNWRKGLPFSPNLNLTGEQAGG